MNNVDVSTLDIAPLAKMQGADMATTSAQYYAAEVMNELAEKDPGKLRDLLQLIESVRHTEITDAVTTFAADLIEREADKNEDAAVSFIQRIVKWVEDKVPFLGRWVIKLVPVERVARESYRDATAFVAQFLRDFSQPEK